MLMTKCASINSAEEIVGSVWVTYRGLGERERERKREKGEGRREKGEGMMDLESGK